MKALVLLVFAAVCANAVTNKWDKIFVIMFENHGYNQVQGNSYWTSIMKDSFQLVNYHGVTHPSQPNYVAMIAGSYFTCTSDSNCNLKQSNLADLIEGKRLTWRSYQENYVPGANGDCNLATSINSEYYRKHNPFMSFTDITSNLTRCQYIVTETQFQTDVQKNALPDFSFYTPNIDNDSHDQSLDYSGQYLTNWLAKYYTPYTASGKAFANTLFMVTFDEDEGSEGNHVVAFFRGPGATPGKSQNTTTSYSHYSFTRFIEDNWSLGSLGTNDATSTSFADEIW